MLLGVEVAALLAPTVYARVKSGLRPIGRVGSPWRMMSNDLPHLAWGSLAARGPSWSLIAATATRRFCELARRWTVTS